MYILTMEQQYCIIFTEYLLYKQPCKIDFHRGDQMKKLIAVLTGVMLMGISVCAADCSPWAEESIENATKAGIVPDTLQSDYTRNISRKEFCQLAVQTYMAKTGYAIPEDLQTPFTDIDDDYVTAAYSLDIVSGVGNDKFNPDSDITRQEAAVMLNNLAYMAGVDNSNTREDKFADDEYFADWAEDAIYKVSAIDNGGTAVMTGTGDNKFSPWMNYTREQAIATMYRLYSCDAVPVLIPPGQRDNQIYIGGGYFDTTTFETTRFLENIDVPEDCSREFVTLSGNEIYYILHKDLDDHDIIPRYRHVQALYRINTDGTGNRALTPWSYNIYIGHRYIYYVPEDARTTVVRTNLEGTDSVVADFSAAGGESGWCSIEADDMETAYINLNTGDYIEAWTETEHKYTYDFSTGSGVEIPKDTLTEWMRTDTPYNGRYRYYIHVYYYDPLRNGADYQLHRCKMDGSEDIILNPDLYNDFYPMEEPVVYKGQLYAPDSEEGQLAVFIYDSTGKETIFRPSPVDTVEYRQYYESIESTSDFIGIKDDRIYYHHTVGSRFDNQTHIHSVNIDGTGDKQLTHVNDEGSVVILDN